MRRLTRANNPHFPGANVEPDDGVVLLQGDELVPTVVTEGDVSGSRVPGELSMGSSAMSSVRPLLTPAMPASEGSDTEVTTRSSSSP